MNETFCHVFCLGVTCEGVKRGERNKQNRNVWELFFGFVVDTIQVAIRFADKTTICVHTTTTASVDNFGKFTKTGDVVEKE